LVLFKFFLNIFSLVLLVGVDDNGSGVVAMLEVARQLSEMNKKGIKRKNTILFAAIDLEEYGMRCINIFLMAVLWESICL